MLRMLALFWIIMAGAGLITEGIFRAAGLVPSMRSQAIAPDTGPTATGPAWAAAVGGHGQRTCVTDP
jgi:hypothetical protein